MPPINNIPILAKASDVVFWFFNSFSTSCIASDIAISSLNKINRLNYENAENSVEWLPSGVRSLSLVIAYPEMLEPRCRVSAWLKFLSTSFTSTSRILSAENLDLRDSFWISSSTSAIAFAMAMSSSSNISAKFNF